VTISDQTAPSTGAASTDRHPSTFIGSHARAATEIADVLE